MSLSLGDLFSTNFPLRWIRKKFKQFYPRFSWFLTLWIERFWALATSILHWAFAYPNFSNFNEQYVEHSPAISLECQLSRAILDIYWFHYLRHSFDIYLALSYDVFPVMCLRECVLFCEHDCIASIKILLNFTDGNQSNALGNCLINRKTISIRIDIKIVTTAAKHEPPKSM